MADLALYASGVAAPVLNGNRYILGDIGPGAKGVMIIATRLNAGTLSFTFECRAKGDTVWNNTLGTPASTGTASATGTTSDVWSVDATGKDIAVTITAQSGAPYIVWNPRTEWGT